MTLAPGWLRRLYATPFTVFVSLLALNSVLSFLTSPMRVASLRDFPPILIYWALSQYAIGGALMLVGIAANQRHLETAGCWALIGGALANALAFGLAIGPARFWDQMLVLALLAIATTARLSQLRRGQVLILTLLSPPE